MDLAGWVEAFWIIQTVAPAPQSVEHWVLPESSVNLVFWLPGGWQRPEYLFEPIVSGPTRRPFRKPAIAGEVYIGVRFLPAAGPPLLDCTGSELNSLIQPLRRVQPHWADRLADRLVRSRSESAALNEIVAEVRSVIAERPAFDRRMVAAAAWYRQCPVAVPLDRWSREFDLSERQFRRRFQAAVGQSPRDFRRIVRMQGLVRRELLRPQVAWVALAAQSGFADQAHLANEFRSLSGGPPTLFHQHLKAIDHSALAPHGRILQDAARTTG
jgi:AraC-like DNA-binding protein